MQPYWILCMLFISPVLGSGPLIKNVTTRILGSLPSSMIPLAFGDFNADKYTDVFVTDSQERSKISILFAIPQTLASSPSSPYFDVEDLRRKRRTCQFNRGVIQGASLGDFDGDGCLDVNVRFEDHSLVLWGDRDPVDGSHALICNDDAIAKGWNHAVYSDIHPLVLDENGDYVADFFTSVNKTTPGFYMFHSDRKKAPQWKPLADPDTAIYFRTPHSNSYVDLNGDGNADLFITTTSGFEIWLRNGDNNFSKVKDIPMDYPYVGQASFADFNLDGFLDIIVPVCHDKKCLNGTVLMGTLTKLSKIGESILSPVLVQEDFEQWKLDRIESDKDIPYYELTPRVGDINLDGYPDVLIRLQHKTLGYIRTNLFLNSEAKPNFSKMPPTPSPPAENKGRSLVFRPEYTRGANDTIMASFFDFFEDGSLDLFTVSHIGKEFKIGAFTNTTQNSDAYFIKVIVLTGVKPPCSSSYDCKGEPVPYGTSFAGQSVCYKSHRPDIDQSVIVVESCSSQLTQTAHNVLQLPYTIFGLGLSPNFIDYMSVSVTNSTIGSQNHTWPQIIPNSQLYVIPYPPSEPYEWLLKLYVTPSRSITLTGLALAGTCGLVALIIGVLHWRDRRADYRERREESHRFHFDAM